MPVKVPVHNNNSSLKTIGYGDYLGGGAAYTVRQCQNTSYQYILFGTPVVVNSVSADGLRIVTASHGIVQLLPWETFPFSFNSSLAGTAFNSYGDEFNTFITKRSGYSFKAGGDLVSNYVIDNAPSIIVSPPVSPPPPPPVDQTYLTLLQPDIWLKADAGVYVSSSNKQAVADNGNVGLWEDQSGNGYHFTDSPPTAAYQYSSSKGLVQATSGAGNAFVPTQTFTFDRRNFSAFFVGETLSLRRKNTTGPDQGIVFSTNDATCNIYRQLNSANPFVVYNGSTALASTSVPFSGRHVFGVVGTASSLKFWVNGVSSTVAPLTAGTTTLTVLGNSASPHYGGYRDVLFYKKSFTDSQVNSVILPYGNTRGAVTSGTNLLITDGDSISNNASATGYRGWQSYIYPSLPANYLYRNCAEASITLASLASSASARLDTALLSGNNILVVFAGTNDIALTGASGATVNTTLRNYVTARRAAGVDKVIVVTPLPRSSNGINGQYAIYRNAILADPSFADYVVDPVGDGRLVNALDNYYFSSDGIHPSNLGHAVLGELIGNAVTMAINGQIITSSVAGGIFFSRQARKFWG